MVAYDCCVCNQMCINFTVVSQARPHKSVNTQFSALLLLLQGLVQSWRAQFPALESAGTDVFADGAAGTQVPAVVAEAVINHMLHRNANVGGAYRTSEAALAAVTVRDLTTWTFLQHDGPNHLGLRCNAAPCASNGPNHLGLCATGGPDGGGPAAAWRREQGGPHPVRAELHQPDVPPDPVSRPFLKKHRAFP